MLLCRRCQADHERIPGRPAARGADGLLRIAGHDAVVEPGFGADALPVQSAPELRHAPHLVGTMREDWRAFSTASSPRYMLGEVMIVLLTCYLPFFNLYLNTAQARWYHFFVPAVLGSTIFIADEVRKYFVRKHPQGVLARLAW